MEREETEGGEQLCRGALPPSACAERVRGGCAGRGRRRRELTAPLVVLKAAAGRDGDAGKGGKGGGCLGGGGDPPRLGTVTIPANLATSGGSGPGMSSSHCLC